MQPFRLLRFGNRIESTLLLFLAVDRLRTVLAVKGSLRRAEDGAPLTAPGRSEETLPNKEGKENWETYDLGNSTSRHLNRRDQVRATKPRGTCTAAGGWMPKISRRPARGRDFSLDILFYRTRSALVRGESERGTLKKVAVNPSMANKRTIFALGKRPSSSNSCHFAPVNAAASLTRRAEKVRSREYLAPQK
jgi:hypothetical protein